jgi:hypothetical protein
MRITYLTIILLLCGLASTLWAGPIVVVAEGVVTSAAAGLPNYLSGAYRLQVEYDSSTPGFSDQPGTALYPSSVPPAKLVLDFLDTQVRFEAFDQLLVSIVDLNFDVIRFDAGIQSVGFTDANVSGATLTLLLLTSNLLNGTALPSEDLFSAGNFETRFLQIRVPNNLGLSDIVTASVTSVTAYAVPEPATLGLTLCSGLMLLLNRTRLGWNLLQSRRSGQALELPFRADYRGRGDEPGVTWMKSGTSSIVSLLSSLSNGLMALAFLLTARAGLGAATIGFNFDGRTAQFAGGDLAANQIFIDDYALPYAGPRILLASKAAAASAALLLLRRRTLRS